VNADPTLRDRGPTATTTGMRVVDRRPARQPVNDPTANVVIRVITDQHTLDAAATAAAQPGAALMMGHGAVSARFWRRPSETPPLSADPMPSGQPEKGYRPSAELAEFVRMRDLFCRFPAATSRPSAATSTMPTLALGPTHASNLNCKCRKHHLMRRSGPASAAGRISSCRTGH
jgi:hypothetical protein